MTVVNKRRRNPTHGDVILAMLAQAANVAQDKVIAADADRRDYARGERDALINARDRVRRYLDGDTSALY